MTVSIPPSLSDFGDGATKLYGMENFGNTCYCNLILQCLYYTTKFRQRVLSHNFSPHERKSEMPGASPHSYTAKYEQLLAKKFKERGKFNGSAGDNSLLPGNPAATRPSIRNSIFAKFSLQNSPVATQEDPPVSSLCSSKGYIQEAQCCESLLVEQRLIIRKNPDFHDLLLFVTRPTSSASSADLRNDLSVSSSLPLDLAPNPNGVPVSPDPLPVSSTSSYVVIGIPNPEQGLLPPINPFNPNPSADHRKRSALINGPILNIDYPLSAHSECEDRCLVYALKDIFEAMSENLSQTGVVSPLYFTKKLKEKNFLFRQANMHHDAHEFCNYLINETIETLNMELQPQSNWCTELFQGTITNETKCLSCEKVTSKDESFLDLSVDIPPGESAFSLTFSLNNFSKLETLNHQNKFYCNACLSLQEAVKTIKLKKTPEVLVINFKRFKYDDKLDRMVKLFDSILYPLNLRLFNTTLGIGETFEDGTITSSSLSASSDDFSLYGLYALVVHIGGGPMHGHYVALCKCQAGLWFLFDDETVELVEDSYVLQFFGDGPGLASAYMLFYQVLDTKVLEDGLDFGINMEKVYRGTDYAMATLDSDFREHSRKMDKQVDKKMETPQKVPEWDEVVHYSPVELKPVDSTEEKTASRTASLLKKTFLLDMKDGEKSKETSTLLAGAKFGKPVDAGDPLTPKPGVKSEKKSWVGGLKRRELKPELVPEERTVSAGSTRINSSVNAESGFTEESSGKKVKRKGNFFSFKKKSNT